MAVFNDGASLHNTSMPASEVLDSALVRISERFDITDIERMDSIRYYLLSNDADSDRVRLISELMGKIAPSVKETVYYSEGESKEIVSVESVSMIVDYIFAGIDSMHVKDLHDLKLSIPRYFPMSEDKRERVIKILVREIDNRGKSYHDWCLIDSMLKFGKAKFRHMDSDRMNIIREYLFNCSNEDSSEGISDDFGEAFMINDKFYEQIMGLYDSVTPSQQEHMIMHLNGAIYFYLDTWAARKHLDIIKFNEFEHWVDSIDNIDTIKQLRADFRNDPYKLLEPFTSSE
ncbi:MAG: hypothetical protein K2M55_07645 [Muribaculaceae bacterium]|nr:hypothetical protein [Muribaculaceae bacterium]